MSGRENLLELHDVPGRNLLELHDVPGRNLLELHPVRNLWAEITLSAIALTVIAYRVLGGSNEWLTTHGIIITLFYAVGGLVYDQLENWSLMETTYFLTVTITTVGYGDYCPVTPEGRLFTVVYGLVGIVFVFAALSPLVSVLMFFKDLILRPFTPLEPHETDEDGTLEIDDLRQRGNWTFKYFSALMGPLLIFLAGLVIGYVAMGLDGVDAIYWSMITMTTIGYGDIAGSTMLQQAILCLYLPTAVAALAEAISEVQTIATAKRLAFEDFAQQADCLLLSEAGAGPGKPPNPTETLSEAEFLVSVLKGAGIVDDLTVAGIRLQFAHITRHDASEDSDTKVLDDAIVFAELRAQGRIEAHAGPTAPKTTAAGFVIERVDTSAADGGFAEWRETFWWARVYAGTERAEYVPLARAALAQKDEAAVAASATKQRGGEGASYAQMEAARRTQNGGGGATGGAEDEVPILRASWPVTVPGEPATMPQQSYRAYKPRSVADECLWILLLVVTIFYLYMILSGRAFDKRSPSKNGGGASLATEGQALTMAQAAGARAVGMVRRQLASPLASARVGDVISSEMLTEIERLLATREL